MVSVKLTENSRLGSRCTINGLERMTEITQNDSASIPLSRAIVGLSDENLMFTFEESDREGILLLNEKLLKIGFEELGKELGSAEDLCDLLLPKKELSKAKPKPKAKKSSKTTKKSSLSED